MSQIEQAADRALQDAAAELLARLLRFNTVNPPGNELAAQEHLAALLSAAGFECALLGALPERPNLVARLRGRSAGPTLCYLGHIDTVLADPGEWEHDPFGGELHDGCLWGRGAIDMKSQVAAEVAAGAALAGSGWRPARGDLLIVTVVDEETGGELGAQWITAEHPEQVRCEMLVNEGAGGVFEIDGQRYYGVCCAEKGVYRFTVKTAGVAAHASLPGLGDNALLKLGGILSRFAAGQPAPMISPQAEEFLRAIGSSAEELDGLLARLAASDRRLEAIFAPFFGITFSPTRIRASEKINVIPSEAELKVDCRVPPGAGSDDVLRAIGEVLELGAPATAGSPPPGQGFRIDFTEQMAANSSPAETPLMSAIARWVGEHDSGARVVPVMLPGFSDSRHFREVFPECTAYGFFPQRDQRLLEVLPLMHGANERIDVRDLGFAACAFRDLALDLLG